MRAQRFTSILALLVLLLGGIPVLTPRPAAAQEGACFAETGFCVQGRFLAYWTASGGLARNGFPLSDTVQYFERVRLEYHPENAPQTSPYDPVHIFAPGLASVP